MNNLSEDEYEISSSTVFRQQASELSSVKSLEDTLGRFGYARDDRIERRELVLMFNTVDKDMEREITRLASDGNFDAAKDTRETITSIRNEFCKLQTDATKHLLHDQIQLFDKAQNLMTKNLKLKHTNEIETLNKKIEESKHSEQLLHDIQTENLEKIISNISKPKVKYSKRLIELFKAESGYLYIYNIFIYLYII